MKYYIPFLSICLLVCACNSNQSTPEEQTTNSSVTPSEQEEVSSSEPVKKESLYSEELAYELGADEYGMRQYVFAYLKKGPNRDLDSLEAAQLQRAHLDNISKLAREGKLVLAGPFMDNTEIRGIYVFAVESLEEAEKIALTDPAIEAGSLEMELHPWYGSAALMMVNDWHKKISKENI